MKKFDKNTMKKIAIAAACALLIIIAMILIVSSPTRADVVPDVTLTPDNNVQVEIVPNPDTVEDVVDNNIEDEDDETDNDVVTDDIVDDFPSVPNDTFVDEIVDFDNNPEIPDNPVIEDEEIKDVIDNEIVDEEFNEEIVEENVLFEINYNVCYNITFDVENIGRFIVKLDNYCSNAVMYFMYVVTTYEGPMTFTQTSNGLVFNAMGEQVLFLEETVTFNGETFGYVRVGFNVVNNMIFGETTTFNVVSTLVEEY
jgi:hypothetical protein